MQSDSAQIQIQQMLTSTPPAFSIADVLHIAHHHYGIEATAKPLDSERDQNFQLTSNDGTRFTLKIANHAEKPEVVDFQNRALMHVAGRDPSIPLPRVIPTLDGQAHCQVEHDGKIHIVRILSWLDGLLLHESKIDIDLSFRLGSLLARLGVALKDFDHPASNPPLLWDMKRAAGLSDLLVHIDEPALKTLIAKTLDQFVSNVKPILDTLRSQVIHNDLNPGNFLLDQARPGKISGVIDFGDMAKSPLIIDLAVAASYLLDDGDDPLAGVLPLIAGYHAVTPLLETELRLLTDLIRTRLITSLLINSCRVKLFPENTEYLMNSHASARRFLTHLDGLDNDVALKRIRAYLQADQESCTP